MTEADVTSQMLSLLELTFLSVSLSFTVISAYVVGLYWFLRHTSVLLKAICFLGLSLTLIVMGVSSLGIARHAEAINKALLQMKAAGTLSPLGQMASEGVTLSIAPMLSVGLTAVFGLIYCGLFYLTFFFRWREREPGQ